MHSQALRAHLERSVALAALLAIWAIKELQFQENLGLIK
jgi:hypothetical protein